MTFHLPLPIGAIYSSVMEPILDRPEACFQRLARYDLLINPFDHSLGRDDRHRVRR